MQQREVELMRTTTVRGLFALSVEYGTVISDRNQGDAALGFRGGGGGWGWGLQDRQRSHQVSHHPLINPPALPFFKQKKKLLLLTCFKRSRNIKQESYPRDSPRSSIEDRLQNQRQDPQLTDEP